MAKVEFLFDFGSPNAYLAHLVIPEVEKRQGVKFEYLPVLLGGVQERPGAGRHRGPDDVIRKRRRAGGRPHLGQRDPAAVRQLSPEHQVSEGEVSEQLPVRDERVQPFDVLRGQPRLTGQRG